MGRGKIRGRSESSVTLVFKIGKRGARAGEKKEISVIITHLQMKCKKIRIYYIFNVFKKQNMVGLVGLGV